MILSRLTYFWGGGERSRASKNAPGPGPGPGPAGATGERRRGSLQECLFGRLLFFGGRGVASFFFVFGGTWELGVSSS